MHLDDTNKKLLNIMQGEFPLGREPFSTLGLRLGISSAEVLRRIERLKASGIVHQIAPVFDARRLGYQTTLVAMRVAGDRLSKAVQVINKCPGVSHGYERDHHFNFWFTLAVPAEVDMQGELEKLDSLIGAEAILNLPALKVFKIGAYFDVVGDNWSIPNTSTNHASTPGKDLDLSSVDRFVINELQQDLPLVQRPFDLMSARLSMDVNEFLNRCQSLQQRGVMRRFGASISHNNVGFVANAMACWRVPPAIVEVAGRKLAALREVSHCYQRKTSSLWPYNLFAMIHAHTKEACWAVADKVYREAGLNESGYILLFSTKEFKKVRVKYLV